MHIVVLMNETALRVLPHLVENHAKNLVEFRLARHLTRGVTERRATGVALLLSGLPQLPQPQLVLKCKWQQRLVTILQSYLLALVQI